MKKLSVLLGATVVALGSFAWSASAMEMPAAGPSAQSDVIQAGYICGPGYHLGPHGHYCWPNGGAVPPHWTKPCPPGYHLGPEKHLCWPN